MKKLKINKRFPLSTALKEEYFVRLEKIRNRGFTIPEIFVLGIKKAEELIKRRDKRNVSSNKS